VSKWGSWAMGRGKGRDRVKRLVTTLRMGRLIDRVCSQVPLCRDWMNVGRRESDSSGMLILPWFSAMMSPKDVQRAAGEQRGKDRALESFQVQSSRENQGTRRACRWKHLPLEMLLSGATRSCRGAIETQSCPSGLGCLSQKVTDRTGTERGR
jgi:hypothetical protein